MSSWNALLLEDLLHIFRGIDTHILDNEVVSTLTHYFIYHENRARSTNKNIKAYMVIE